MFTPVVPDLLNYIADDALRESLVSDYREMETAAKIESWKCVQVLAGSLVETLLIDYLLVSKPAGMTDTQVMNLGLNGAIKESAKQKLLEEKTEKLCEVVRDYRNLIHPGRMLRLQELPSRESALIALQLVSIVAKKIAEQRRKKYGYTALEVLAKLEGDSKAFTVVAPSLLKELNDAEKRRLLFKLLPERNHTWRTELEAGGDQEDVGHLHDRIRCLKHCFRELLLLVGEQTQAEVRAKYLEILRKGAGPERTHYELAFVKAADVALLPPEDSNMVTNHLLTLLENPEPEVLECTLGIGKYIGEAMGMWDRMDRIIRAATSLHGADIESWQHWFTVFGDGLADGARQYALKSVNEKLGECRNRKVAERFMMIRASLEEDIPF